MLHLCHLKILKFGLRPFIFFKEKSKFQKWKKREVGRTAFPFQRGLHALWVAVAHASSDGGGCTLRNMLCPQRHRILRDKVIFSPASFRSLIIGTEVPAVFANIKNLKCR